MFYLAWLGHFQRSWFDFEFLCVLAVCSRCVFMSLFLILETISVTKWVIRVVPERDIINFLREIRFYNLFQILVEFYLNSGFKLFPINSTWIQMEFCLFLYENAKFGFLAKSWSYPSQELLWLLALSWRIEMNKILWEEVINSLWCDIWI